jgi:hypothetical protein
VGPEAPAVSAAARQRAALREAALLAGWAEAAADRAVWVHAQGYSFITDGKKRKERSSVGEMEIKARWKDERLVVETRLEGGLKTTRTLWLDASSGTRALIVMIKVEGGTLPNAVQARYVYHAAST